VLQPSKPEGIEADARADDVQLETNTGAIPTPPTPVEDDTGPLSTLPETTGKQSQEDMWLSDLSSASDETTACVSVVATCLHPVTCLNATVAVCSEIAQRKLVLQRACLGVKLTVRIACGLHPRQQLTVTRGRLTVKPAAHQIH
jgi:hypothetical protein